MRIQSNPRPKDFNYQRYLASREWGLRKAAVHERSGGICERCREADGQAVHHLTYEHIGDEPIEDLLHVCNPCHEFLSGTGDYDPTEPPPLPLGEEIHEWTTLQILQEPAEEGIKVTHWWGFCPRCSYGTIILVEPDDFWACSKCWRCGGGLDSWKKFLTDPPIPENFPGWRDPSRAIGLAAKNGWITRDQQDATTPNG